MNTWKNALDKAAQIAGRTCHAPTHRQDHGKTTV